jgi:sugar lactone lactonase YvrE
MRSKHLYILLLFFTQCEEKSLDIRDFPRIETTDFKLMPAGRVIFFGKYLVAGKSDVIDHGFTWSETTFPTIENSAKVSLGNLANPSTFEGEVIDEFIKGEKYLVRAYAVTSDYTVYGQYLSFTLPEDNNLLEVTSLAGSIKGYADGLGESAMFDSPSQIAIDADGSVIVADKNNHRVRKITRSGEVSTVAGGAQGNSDGTGINASFNFPTGVAIDAQGNIYVGDTGNNVIRKIATNGSVKTFAGSSSNAPSNENGTGTSARFNAPGHLSIDGFGNIYVVDTGNKQVRKITPAGEVTSVFRSLNSLVGIASDKTGNIYVSSFSNKIEKISNTVGLTTILDNQADLPYGLAVDRSGNIYVANTNSSTIGKIDLIGAYTVALGKISSTPSFMDGPALQAIFNSPESVAIDALGNLFVADTKNHKIRVAK